MKLTKLESPEGFMKGLDSTGVEIWKTDAGLRIIMSVDNTPKWGPLKHISISHAHRYPFWDEIVAIKNHFYGENLDTMMILPKKCDWVNVHENCFHLWQTPEAWGELENKWGE